MCVVILQYALFFCTLYAPLAANFSQVHNLHNIFYVCDVAIGSVFAFFFLFPSAFGFDRIYFVLKIRITYHIIHFDCELENRIVRNMKKGRQIDDSLWKLMENQKVKKYHHKVHVLYFLCFSSYFPPTNFPRIFL